MLRQISEKQKNIIGSENDGPGITRFVAYLGFTEVGVIIFAAQKFKQCLTNE